MYIPAAYQEDDRAALVAFMQAHSFATLVSVLDGAPFASHVPLVVGADADSITISGHLAKANPQLEALAAGEALAVFSGPHAYVSPANYDRRESVPTWNYIAVHAAGQPRLIRYADEPRKLEAMLDAMIAAYEPGYASQWAGLGERYRTGMLQGIVGFEFAVARLEGKYKLSQNRSLQDQQRVAASLARSPDPAAQALGAAMPRRRREPTR